MLSITLIVGWDHTVEGVVLARSSDAFRIAIPGMSDTMELRLVDGCWTVEGKMLAELGAMVTDGYCVAESFVEAYSVCAATRPESVSSAFSAVAHS